MEAVWYQDASKNIDYRFLSDCCDAKITQKRFRDKKLDILPFKVPATKKSGSTSHSYFYRYFCTKCEKMCTNKLETRPFRTVML